MQHALQQYHASSIKTDAKCTSSCWRARSMQLPRTPPAAAAAAAADPRLARLVACRSAGSSSQAAPAGSRRPRGLSRQTPPSSKGSSVSQQQQQQRAASKPLEPLIHVAVNTTSAGVATAVLLRLQQLGTAEIWATSAANHFTAVAGLGLAAQQLLQSQPQQPQQHQQQQVVEGLSATAMLTFHDQPVKDDQKRRLNKLELRVQPAAQINPALLTPGRPGGSSISTNRTTSIADVLGLMQQQLLVAVDQSSSSVAPGAVCVVEARGEQAVTRALKAGLSLQAAAGVPLLLRPVAGQVVDVVAEKRGQVALADGLMLLFSWGDAAAAEDQPAQQQQQQE